MQTAVEADAELEDQDGIEHIDDPARIRFLMTRARDERVWLSVRLEGCAVRFRSVIIDNEPQRQALLLDELMPREIPANLGPDHPMRISAELDGARLMFDTRLQGIVETDDAPACRCETPASLMYWQRRREHRSVVGFGATIPVRVSAAEHAIVEGRLFDISSGGLSILLDDADAPIDEITRTPATARIELPEGTGLEAPINLLHVHCDEGETHVRLGGRFGDLTPEQRRRIVRFVMACERGAARRKVALSDR